MRLKGEQKMTYQSKKHKEIFDKAMEKKNENNYRLIAAIYLLTADNELWKAVKACYLYERANEKGECWPAIPTIARELKISEQTVRRGIEDLKKQNLIKTTQRYRTKGGKSSLLFQIL